MVSFAATDKFSSHAYVPARMQTGYIESTPDGVNPKKIPDCDSFLYEVLTKRLQVGLRNNIVKVSIIKITKKHYRN